MKFCFFCMFTLCTLIYIVNIFHFRKFYRKPIILTEKYWISKVFLPVISSSYRIFHKKRQFIVNSLSKPFPIFSLQFQTREKIQKLKLFHVSDWYFCDRKIIWQNFSNLQNNMAKCANIFFSALQTHHFYFYFKQ